ncbi:DUF6632 domain-containing protein [Saccharospirillum impatiens]|uniref:DUF6632 domain-containing protein n=1 Tax=Saccharospirillum impatiens TaxID=169438 RepID=UPI003CCBCC03
MQASSGLPFVQRLPSTVHAGVMLVQAIMDEIEYANMLGDIRALFLVAFVLWFLMPNRLLKLFRMNRGFGNILSVKLIRSQSDNARSRHHSGSFIFHGPPGLLRPQRSPVASDQGFIRYSADPH